MDFFFKNIFYWIIVFLFVILFSILLFMYLEYIEKDDVKEKYEMLCFLYEFMLFKYNIIIEEFNNFMNVVYEVLSEFKL